MKIKSDIDERLLEDNGSFCRKYKARAREGVIL